MSATNRLHRAILIGSTVLGSWLGMQAAHEAGHVLGAWATGGKVERVVLNPLTISRTDLDFNPHPLAVVWAGPLVGVFLPTVLGAAASRARMRGSFVLRFFAGFCLVANGAYIAVGSWDHIGDCGDMLLHGCPVAFLWLFGLLTVPGGIALWNRLGRHFGVGSDAESIDPCVTWATLLVCLTLIGMGFLIDGR
jgi:hypothetical protein